MHQNQHVGAVAATALALALWVVVSAQVVSRTLNPVERASLVDFYESTGGPQWSDGQSWRVDNASSDPCADKWVGVTCQPPYYADATTSDLPLSVRSASSLVYL